MKFEAQQFGLKEILLVTLVGLISAVGQPPYGIILAHLLANSLFFLTLNQTHNNFSIFKFSFFFGYGYFLFSQYWINNSLLNFGSPFIWLYPLGIIGLPAIFAIYFVIFGFLVKKFASDNPAMIALAWVIVEIIRSYGVIELPWLLSGYIWYDSKILMQNASWIGIWGLSFITILISASINLVIKIYLNWHSKYIKKQIFEALFWLFISSIIGSFCIFYGKNHLNKILVEQNFIIRLIQPNFLPNIYSSTAKNQQNLSKMLNLSKSNHIVDMVIWPEGSINYKFNNLLKDKIAEIAPPNGGVIFNIDRLGAGKLFNSLVLIKANGELIDIYNKQHLVAFGEYVPFKKFIPLINKFTEGSLDFSRGSKNKILTLNNSIFFPTICFEDVFPIYESSKFNWIINTTNDSWFGNSIGPYQHLAYAKFRSIEMGVPTVRATLNGVSAVINSFGEIIESLALNQEGVIEKNIPSYLKDATLFKTQQNKLFLFFIILLLLVNITYKNLIKKKIC